MSRARKATKHLVVCFLVACSTTVQARADCAWGGKIRVGALYSESNAGRSHLAGIQSAVRDRGAEECVQVVPLEYRDEHHGLERLLAVVEKGQVDIFLGPTDSGIYTEALTNHHGLAERQQIPIISSLVTAVPPNNPDGWFFTTSVDVVRRVDTIYSFLTKRWISSIAILHADTEFGRQAAGAFNKRLTGSQKNMYISRSYKSPAQDDLWDPLQEVLDHRPEAIGIFGANDHIRQFYTRLRGMNKGIQAYQPIVFALLDARDIEGEVHNLYFVSVSQELNEIEALSFDTTVLILDELGKVDVSINRRKQFRTAFRDRFAGLLSGTVQAVGPRTHMKFDTMVNSVQPAVFHKHGDQVERASSIGFVDVWRKMDTKLELLWGRYGLWIIVNAILMIVVLSAISLLDLKRWYEGPYAGLFRNYHVYVLVGMNCLLALLLYGYLAETGRIRYDSVVMALIIAVAPSALVRTTFLETPTGGAIGLGRAYDRFLLWINDSLMMARYRSQNNNVNIIAYYNAYSDMRGRLEQIFRNARTTSQRERLLTELEEGLREANTTLERRRVCARHLLRRCSWKELQKMGFVPVAFSDENPADPELIIRNAGRHCAEDAGRRQKVLDLVQDHLSRAKQSDAHWAELIENELNAELKDANTALGKLYIRIRFLHVIFSFSEERLKKQDLLPQDEDQRTSNAA